MEYLPNEDSAHSPISRYWARVKTRDSMAGANFNKAKCLSDAVELLRKSGEGSDFNIYFMNIFKIHKYNTITASH